MARPSNGMRLHRGAVVLVPFPFTDLTSQKVRPAVIVSSDPQEEDVVVVFISSVLPRHASANEFVLKNHHPDYPATGLKVSSVFKMRKLLTLHRSMILRYLGQLSASLQVEIDKRLALSLGIER